MKWIKRILVSLVVLLGGAVATLGLLGMREGANRLEASVTVARPPEAVWPFLYEEARLKKWVQWLEEAKPSEAPAVGKRGTWVMKDMNNGGALMKIESLVTAAEPARRLEVDLDVKGAFKGHGLYVLTPVGEGGKATRVETRQEFVFDQWFAKLMTPVVALAAGSKAQKDLELLKAAVEAE